MSASSQKRWSQAVVVSATARAKSVVELLLRYDHTISEAIEGSHLDVEVTIDHKPATRSYSVVRREGHELAIAVALSTASRGGSQFMHSLRPGMVIGTTQPLTTFPFRPGRRSEYLAAGIGITALVAMADTSRRLGDPYRLTYLGRNESTMAFTDDLRATHGPNVVIHETGQAGRLDLFRYVAELDDDAVLYFCGPLPMLEDLRLIWATSGRRLGDLRFETFGTAGTLRSTSFTVTVADQGIEVEVDADQSILDALEAAGAEVMFGCRKGECGLCQVDICQVEGIVDHRDVFFSAQQHSAAIRLCTCVSRISATTGNPLPRVTLRLP